MPKDYVASRIVHKIVPDFSLMPAAMQAANKEAALMGLKAGQSYSASFRRGVGSLDVPMEPLHQQTSKLNKGFGSLGLTMAAVFGGGLVLHEMKQLIDASEELSDAVDLSTHVFGSNAAAMQQWSDTATETMGISKREALQTSSVLGNLLINAGVGLQQTRQISQELMARAADIATAVGGSQEQAIGAIQTALLGKTTQLRNEYGITLSQREIEDRAYTMGLWNKTAALTASAKAQATANLFMEKSANMAGEYDRQRGDPSAIAARSRAEIENLSAELGEKLLPIYAEFLKQGSKVIGFVADHKELALALTAVTAALVTMALAWKALGLAIDIAKSKQLAFIASGVGNLGSKGLNAALGMGVGGSAAMAGAIGVGAIGISSEISNWDRLTKRGDSMGAAIGGGPAGAFLGASAASSGEFVSGVLGLGNMVGLDQPQTWWNDVSGIDATQKQMEAEAELARVEQFGKEAAERYAAAQEEKTRKMKEGIYATDEQIEAQTKYYETVKAGALQLMGSQNMFEENRNQGQVKAADDALASAKTKAEEARTNRDDVLREYRAGSQRALDAQRAYDEALKAQEEAAHKAQVARHGESQETLEKNRDANLAAFRQQGENFAKLKDSGLNGAAQAELMKLDQATLTNILSKPLDASFVKETNAAYDQRNVIAEQMSMTVLSAQEEIDKAWEVLARKNMEAYNRTLAGTSITVPVPHGAVVPVDNAQAAKIGGHIKVATSDSGSAQNPRGTHVTMNGVTVVASNPADLMNKVRQMAARDALVR